MPTSLNWKPYLCRATTSNLIHSESKGWLKWPSVASPRRLPMPSTTPPVSAFASCRSRRKSYWPADRTLLDVVLPLGLYKGALVGAKYLREGHLLGGDAA